MMELFVILIVIFATHCTADAITSNLLSSIEIVYTDATFRFTGITQDNYKTLTGDDWPDAAGDDIPDEGVSVAINLAKMETNSAASDGFEISNPSTNTYGAASSGFLSLTARALVWFYYLRSIKKYSGIFCLLP